MKKYKGELALLLVALIWGTGFVLTAIVLEQFDTFQILAARFLLSALIMSAVFHKKMRALDRTAIRRGAALGAFIVAGYTLQTIGLIFTTPAKNAFITGAAVVVVPFIGTVVYRRKLDLYCVLGAATAFFGIGVLSFQFDSAVNIGDMLTLAGTVLFAFHVFFTAEFMARRSDAASLVIVQMATAGVFSAGAALVTGQVDVSRANTTGVLLLVFMAVVTTSICFFVQTWAQKFTTDTKAAIVMSTECLFGALFSIALGFDRLTIRMVLAAALIMGGMLITEVRPVFWKKKGAEGL